MPELSLPRPPPCLLLLPLLRFLLLFLPVAPGRGPFLATPPLFPDCFVFILATAASAEAAASSFSARLDPFSEPPPPSVRAPSPAPADCFVRPAGEASVAEPSPWSVMESCAAPPLDEPPEEPFLLTPGRLPFFVVLSASSAGPPPAFLLTPGRLPAFPPPSLRTSSSPSDTSPFFRFLASLALALAPRLFPPLATCAAPPESSPLLRFFLASLAPPSPSLESSVPSAARSALAFAFAPRRARSRILCRGASPPLSGGRTACARTLRSSCPPSVPTAASTVDTAESIAAPPRLPSGGGAILLSIFSTSGDADAPHEDDRTDAAARSAGARILRLIVL